MTKPKAPKKQSDAPAPAAAKAPRADAVNRTPAKKPAAKSPATGRKAKPKVKAKQKRAPQAPDKKVLAAQQPDAEKRGKGRPPKITQQIQDDICKAIRGGSFMETAAAYGGISKDTLYAWMRHGARGEGAEYVKFSDAIKKALAESEVQGIAQIRAHGKESWQAVAWYLERRFKERWGRSIKIDNDLKDKSTEELLALLEDPDTAGA
jgi:transposase